MPRAKKLPTAQPFLLTIKVSTYVKYRKLIYTYIIPAIGHLKLEKLTPQHVKSLYNQKEKNGLSPKSINSIHGVLHMALKMQCIGIC